MSTNEEAGGKIGAGHAQAMLRQGLKELRGALYTQSNVAQPGEYGLYGTATPQEVMDTKRTDAKEAESSPSVLDERLKQLEAREEERQRSAELERE